MCSQEQETHVYRVWLQAECIAGVLSMFSIRSPDYVFTVLVSAFVNPWSFSKRNPSAINMFTLVYIVRGMGVHCFHYLCMCIANYMHHIRTYVQWMYIRLQHYVWAIRCRTKHLIFSSSDTCKLANFLSFWQVSVLLLIYQQLLKQQDLTVITHTLMHTYTRDEMNFTEEGKYVTFSKNHPYMHRPEISL